MITKNGKDQTCKKDKLQHCWPSFQFAIERICGNDFGRSQRWIWARQSDAKVIDDGWGSNKEILWLRSLTLRWIVEDMNSATTDIWRPRWWRRARRREAWFLSVNLGTWFHEGEEGIRAQVRGYSTIILRFINFSIEDIFLKIFYNYSGRKKEKYKFFNWKYCCFITTWFV